LLKSFFSDKDIEEASALALSITPDEVHFDCSEFLVLLEIF
jgi:hypothetical protein